MPQTYKVLGQLNPSASGLSTLYTVPSSTSAVISTLSIANLSSSSSTFRAAISPTGASISNAQYIAYDISLIGNDTIFLTLGLSLGAGDIVRVYSSSANTSFSLFGVEIT